MLLIQISSKIYAVLNNRPLNYGEQWILLTIKNMPSKPSGMLEINILISLIMSSSDFIFTSPNPIVSIIYVVSFTYRFNSLVILDPVQVSALSLPLRPK